MPRQRSIHFKSESEPRRHKIVDTIIALGVRTTIYDAGAYPSDQQARRACLLRLVEDLAQINAERLVLELDDAAVQADREVLYAQCHAAGIARTLRYDHMRAHEECLLSIPDAIAWCWARGGAWRTKVQGLVTEIQRVT